MSAGPRKGAAARPTLTRSRMSVTGSHSAVTARLISFARRVIFSDQDVPRCAATGGGGSDDDKGR